jgi:hypothetical protein
MPPKSGPQDLPCLPTLSISITAPSSGGTVGPSFTVGGNYSSPNGTPTFTCYLTPEDPAGDIAPVYLTFPQTAPSTTWEAYFSGVPAGTYSIFAQVTFGSESQSTSESVTVADPPPVRITAPAEGTILVAGTYTVTGAGPSGTVQASLTWSGLTLSGPVSVPVTDAGWQADLLIPAALVGFSDLNVNADLLTDSPNPVGEVAVGKLSVSAS